MAVGYFGQYAKFITINKDEAGALVGPDNIVGDFYTIQNVYENGERQTWIVNAWDIKMGLLSEEVAEKIDLCDAKGWNTVALLSYVAYTQNEEVGTYWGEVAIVSYDPTYEKEFQVFLKKLRSKMASGVRPDLNLGTKALNDLIKNGGNYMPTGRVAMPKLSKGQAFVKQERTTSEYLVNKAREGNKGCYFLSYAFLLCVAALIVYGIINSGILNIFFG